MDNKNNLEPRHELKAFVESIAALARKPLEESGRVEITEIFGRPYYRDRNGIPRQVEAPDFKTPQSISVSSLDGLIDLVKQEGIRVQLPELFASEFEADKADRSNNYSPHLFVEVTSYRSVTVYTDNLNFYRRHYNLYGARSDMEAFQPGKEYGHEEMMIALRSMFQRSDNTDLDYLLGLLGSVTNEAKVTSTDNGLNQQVTVNKGIANIQRENVKSIVRLKPFRTFPEVEQPASDFLVRLSADKEGTIRVALHEADGGMWKLDARRIVAAYLEDSLRDEIEAGLVTVMS